jgi:photosystem II stability/assembly factor-like uncharacterized protein
VYAGGNDGVYKTIDGGDIWVAVKTDSNIYSLAIDPITSSTIYAGAWEGVYKSIDSGSTWVSINSGLPYGPSIRAFAIDSGDPNTIYAGLIAYGIFKSLNGGISWTSVSTGLPSGTDVYALSVDPVSLNILYAATSTGIFKTTNGAQGWTSVNTGLHSAGAYRSVIVDPDNHNVVYVASFYNPYYAGIYRSTDGGATWELARSGIVGADARALAIAPGALYVATDGGVFRSVDGGRRWRGIYPDRPSSLQVRALAVTNVNPQTVFIGAESSEASYRGVWQSTLVSPPPLTLLPTSPPKAVLIVGPIDAPINQDTQAAIEAMEIKATLLEDYGFQVVRLYHPNATWQNIRDNLSGASIVLYWGHGFGYNPGDTNYLSTGGSNNGFCITDPNNLNGATLATQDMLIAYSQLAKNAVVMNFACYSAGSSASDSFVVSEDVAKRRVNDYSYTFLTIGAAAYFPGGDWSYYLNYMLSSPLDHTTGSAYQTGPGYDPATLRAYNHSQYPAKVLWLDPSVNSQGQIQGWWSAFAGNPDVTMGASTGPVVSSIVRADPSPANAASVNFTVTFSENVTGVDISDFTLTTTGVAGAAINSVSGSGSTYTVTVNTGTGSGTIRLDVTDDGSIQNGYGDPLAGGYIGGETYAIQKDSIFADVPPEHWAVTWIERLFRAGITTGCATMPSLLYCPEDPVTRAQMAKFLEKGIHGSAYTPPAGTGMIFADVPLNYWAVNWIEKLYADGITTGCSITPLNYCPEDSVTRAQMAIFLLRAKHGAAYVPPAATGIFADVPTTYWAANWIEQLYAEGITTGCGIGNYCPEDPVTRAQMAVFLVRTFNLP